MSWDKRIARVTPYLALAIAVVAGVLTFAAHYE